MSIYPSIHRPQTVNPGAREASIRAAHAIVRPDLRSKPSLLPSILPLVLAPLVMAMSSDGPIVRTDSGYVEANGIAYYYEIQGTGEPLLLLHGGLGSMQMFGPFLEALARERRVVTVDLHGHGRTLLGDRPIRYEDIADDLAIVLRELDLGPIDVVGYSFGGGAGIRLAIQHPERVRRLVVISAGYARDGFYSDMLEQQGAVGAAMAEAMRETPMYQLYSAVAPRIDDFPRLLDEMGVLMRTPYDWSADIRNLEIPVMLVYGDSDMFRPEHIVDFYQLLGGGLRDAGWMRENISQNRLAILPDATHYDILMAPDLERTIRPFLRGETRASGWSTSP